MSRTQDRGGAHPWCRIHGATVCRQRRDGWLHPARHRKNARFRTLLDFARLVLDGVSPTLSAGDERSFSLLFPMHRVFEAFVYDDNDTRWEKRTSSRKAPTDFSCRMRAADLEDFLGILAPKPSVA